LAGPAQPCTAYVLGIARSLPALLGAPSATAPGAELSIPGFGPAYVSGIMQTVEWAERTRTPLVLWVVDEPRENPNPWNRNLADTIRHLDLCGQVKGAVRMVTPMGDDNRGKDYTSMLDHLEIVATHATARSGKMIARAMKDPKIRLWVYNTGHDRLSNGLYLWRVGSGGKFEWHFNQWIEGAQQYPGREMHCPFLTYGGGPYTAAAPLEHKGALLLKEGMMTMSAGAADYRYVHTLQREVRQGKLSGESAAAVAEAEKLLAALRKAIPVLPKVKQLGADADLALVGAGIEDDGSLNLEQTKRRMAELIAKLQGGK